MRCRGRQVGYFVCRQSPLLTVPRGPAPLAGSPKRNSARGAPTYAWHSFSCASSTGTCIPSGCPCTITRSSSSSPRGRMRMTELADRTAQSRSRLSHQINRMETRGLVMREGCEGDKRGTFAVLTAHGLATIGNVAPSHVASVRAHFIDQLKPAELTALTEAYGPVLEKLRLIRDRD